HKAADHDAGPLKRAALVGVLDSRSPPFRPGTRGFLWERRVRRPPFVNSSPGRRAASELQETPATQGFLAEAKEYGRTVFRYRLPVRPASARPPSEGKTAGAPEAGFESPFAERGPSMPKKLLLVAALAFGVLLFGEAPQASAASPYDPYAYEDLVT